MNVNEVGMGVNQLKQSLSQFFGFEEFKLNQESIVQSILNGKDTFVSITQDTDWMIAGFKFTQEIL